MKYKDKVGPGYLKRLLVVVEVVRRRKTSPGWDGRRSPLFSDGRVVSGPGRLRTALLAPDDSPRPAGREGDRSVVKSGLASLASLAGLLGLAVGFVLSDGAAHQVWRPGGEAGGGGLDHHLSQGWRGVGPSEGENIEAGQLDVCKPLDHTAPHSHQPGN